MRTPEILPTFAYVDTLWDRTCTFVVRARLKVRCVDSGAAERLARRFRGHRNNAVAVFEPQRWDQVVEWLVGYGPEAEAATDAARAWAPQRGARVAPEDRTRRTETVRRFAALISAGNKAKS